MTELLNVFFQVILPVFGIVVLGASLGQRLELQARTLTRVAYYVFVPAFIFQAISTAAVPFDNTLRMIAFILLTHWAAVVVAFLLGRLLGRSREMIAAWVMIAAFGNVGNYGLALIRFHQGDAALAPATIYFVAISVNAFIICVGAAGWAHGGGGGAVGKVLKTPALWAAVPALLVSAGNLDMPLLMQRMIGLLAEAMIPVMLFSLGLQLREQGRVQVTSDVMIGSAVRLLLVPALAFGVARVVPLGEVERLSGILQSAMPAAILVAIIAKENDIVPAYVTSVVVVSTFISLVSLTVLMTWLP